MDMINKLWKKLIGIDNTESVIEPPEEPVSKTEKELATEKKEPWVAVLTTHVNKDNIRNGFFELDWNEYFIVQLRGAGYTGDTDEAVVDKWFQDLCRNIGAESEIDMERRGSGFINTNNLGNGRTEVS
jgi:hypothetical protein